MGTSKVVLTACRTCEKRRSERKSGVSTCETFVANRTLRLGVRSELIAEHTLSPSSIPGPRKDLALVRFALSKLDLKMSLMPQLRVGKSKVQRLVTETTTDSIKRSARGVSPVSDLLDLTAHLEDVVLRLDDVRSSHQEERIRGLFFLWFCQRTCVYKVKKIKKSGRKNKCVRCVNECVLVRSGSQTRHAARTFSSW